MITHGTAPELDKGGAGAELIGSASVYRHFIKAGDLIIKSPESVMKWVVLVLLIACVRASKTRLPSLITYG